MLPNVPLANKPICQLANFVLFLNIFEPAQLERIRAIGQWREELSLFRLVLVVAHHCSQGQEQLLNRLVNFGLQ